MDKTRYTIFGAGCFGSKLKRELERDGNTVCYYVDNNLSNEKDNIPIVSLSEIKYRQVQGGVGKIVIALSDYYALGDVLLQFYDYGFSDVSVADPRLWREHWMRNDECSPESYIYDIDITEKGILTKLEFHVCDHCNLNCTGCSHFAPIYKDSYADIKQFKRDIVRLSKLFSNILRLRLMGGEPLLCENLDEFIAVAREGFPRSHLEIVTNGLLYKKVKNKVWSVAKDCDCFFQISLYPPTFAIKDELSGFFDSIGVRYSFGSGLEQYNDTGVIDQFHKNLTLSDKHSAYLASLSCMGARCHFLKSGRISKCALPLLSEDINGFFDTEYSATDDDYIDIYSDVNPWEAVKKLKYSIPFCAYCSEKGTERYPWSVTKDIKISDYVCGGIK